MMIFIFGMQINIDVLRACATRHAQSTQNKKFVSFCNISGKALREGGGLGCEVDFLPANEPESFRQVDSITLGLRSQAC